MFPVKTSTVDGHSHLFRVVRGWGQCLIQESRFQDWGGQLVFCSKYISALLTRVDIGNIGTVFFAEQKK